MEQGDGVTEATLASSQLYLDTLDSGRAADCEIRKAVECDSIVVQVEQYDRWTAGYGASFPPFFSPGLSFFLSLSPSIVNFPCLAALHYMRKRFLAYYLTSQNLDNSEDEPGRGVEVQWRVGVQRR